MFIIMLGLYKEWFCEYLTNNKIGQYSGTVSLIELMRVWIDQIRCIVLFVEFYPIHLLHLTWDWIKLIQFKHHN